MGLFERRIVAGAMFLGSVAAVVGCGGATSANDSDGGGTDAGDVRSCPGSTRQSVTYAVKAGCGGAGTITISVSTAGKCGLTVVQSSGVDLPTTGSFATAETSNYALGNGDWDLISPDSAGFANSMNCTGSAGSSLGVIELSCTVTECSTSGTMVTTCAAGPSCTTELTPTG